MDYAEQQALYYLHIPPSEYEKQPYERMMEVLNAESREDRPMSGHEYLAHQNIDIDEANQQLKTKGG
ncbi:hypothetical protein JK159_06735 [Weissella minor]|uniref:hypothetical protein n=1 Tax=Weissella minor TaxID=1620 RepID=UPI001BAF7D3C|nr:hypothetical protein [Weissella minor]MBS0950056.1 hypothetical protein [Weissella minor]